MFNLKKLFQDAHSAIRSERAELEKVQARLAFLKNAPACRSDIETVFDEYDAAAQAEYSARMVRHITDIADYGRFNCSVARQTSCQPVSPVVHQIAAQHRDLSIVLVGLFPDLVRAARAKLLDTFDWSKSGPPMAERAKEIEQLEKTEVRLKAKIADFENELRSAIAG